jgi:hypothetical protein
VQAQGCDRYTSSFRKKDAHHAPESRFSQSKCKKPRQQQNQDEHHSHIFQTSMRSAFHERIERDAFRSKPRRKDSRVHGCSSHLATRRTSDHGWLLVSIMASCSFQPSDVATEVARADEVASFVGGPRFARSQETACLLPGQPRAIFPLCIFEDDAGPSQRARAEGPLSNERSFNPGLLFHVVWFQRMAFGQSSRHTRHRTI